MISRDSLSMDDFWSGRWLGTCERKDRISNPIEATKRAYHLEEIRAEETFDVYRCNFCGCYWHIGHSRDSGRSASEAI